MKHLEEKKSTPEQLSPKEIQNGSAVETSEKTVETKPKRDLHENPESSEEQPNKRLKTDLQDSAGTPSTTQNPILEASKNLFRNGICNWPNCEVKIEDMAAFTR